MTVYKLLTPPGQQEETADPYRPVWRSVIVESALLVLVTLAVFLAFGLLGLQLPAVLTPVINGLLVALPVLLWLIFSVWRERAVPEPRARLVAVFIITALAANALAIPLIEGVLQPERWLPLGGAISRIIGYAFTVGIVQETTKYAVVRFITWPDFFRTRLDSVAYCVASALGYALVLNLRFLFSGANVTPDVMAMQVFDNVAVNLAASLIVGYGLAEVHFDKPMPFLLMITVALGALVNGIVIPLRSGLTNAAFVLPTSTETPSLLDNLIGLFASQSSTPKPILGFAFSAIVLAVFGVLVTFLFSNAERQAREAAKRDD
ncbi:MAG: PrsW family glutamic-type intramembrane protease [Chloroflexota bacterium]